MKYFRKPQINQIEAEIQRLSTINEVRRNTVMMLISTIVLSFLFTRSFLIIEIQGESMIPTFVNGQLMLVKKTKDIQRGDLIVFTRSNELIVKRLIAKSGDNIYITKDGDVYVNDKHLDEPYVEEKEAGNITVIFPQVLKEDQFFVLGDNRNISLDSRDKNMGMVSSEEVIGRIMYSIWPLNVSY